MPTQLAAIQSLIIDMDGVLWRGAKPLPGVAAFFDLLQARGNRFLVVTNNATRTAEFLVERLATMGVHVSPLQVMTSAKATALYLQHELPVGSRVLVIGEEGLLDALRRAGFSAEPADSPDGSQSAAAVVVGLDRGVNYGKLRGASSAILAGARFIATNTDATFPAEQGLVPGAGAIVAAVQTATSVAPTVIGKPHSPMFDIALEILHTSPEHTAMLGDRLDTDIEGAQAAGLATILVLTGVTTAEEARASSVKPDFTFSDLLELTRRWETELAV
jgi:4-nitrophenyl phosphatase